jgi:hypothetical protein
MNATSDLAGVQWRKSTFSGGQGGDCVEIAALPGGNAAVRDSKHPANPALIFTRAEIRAWILGVKAGEFDDLA